VQWPLCERITSHFPPYSTVIVAVKKKRKEKKQAVASTKQFQWLSGFLTKWCDKLQPKDRGRLIVALLCVWALLFCCSVRRSLSPFHLFVPPVAYTFRFCICSRRPRSFGNVTMKFNITSSCAKVHLVKLTCHGWMVSCIKLPRLSPPKTPIPPSLIHIPIPIPIPFPNGWPSCHLQNSHTHRIPLLRRAISVSPILANPFLTQLTGETCPHCTVVPRDQDPRVPRLNASNVV
jgi:hypothetical protein